MLVVVAADNRRLCLATRVQSWASFPASVPGSAGALTSTAVGRCWTTAGVDWRGHARKMLKWCGVGAAVAVAAAAAVGSDSCTMTTARR